jgi:1,4-alpha-glucan branching enzyme
MRFALSLAAIALVAAHAIPASGAGLDNNVEWQGVAHVGWQDLRPLCPVGNEAFAVRFQSWQGDLSAARVHLEDGASNTWISASVVGQRGPYDIWEASVPATSANNIGYYIELTDGSDTDYMSVSGTMDNVPIDGGWRLDFNTLEHAPLGATVASGGTVFKVWAPGASLCYVRGEFNGWGFGNLLGDVGDYFIGFVPGATAGQQYKYYFTPANLWKPDARARALDAGSNYNSIIVDPLSYSWVADDFQTPPKEEMTVYQLHVGTFAGRNDPVGAVSHPSGYLDVAARVGHLVELGVNTVMLNPINEFPGDLSAGYNPISTWAPEWAYGTPDDFKYLVDVLHQNGIAVLLDVIWNHFSYSDNYLWDYDGTQHYFDDPAVDTPWGAQADMDGAEARAYFLNSALHWLEEYRIDGFRMDATSYMTLQGGGWSLMQELNDLVDNRYAGKVVVAEQLPDDDWITRPTTIGGAGFDAQYYDYFTDSMRGEIFDAAVGDPEMWRIRDIINGGGLYLSGGRAFNYIELHDEAWPSSGGQRIVKSIDTTYPHDDLYARARVKLGQGLVTFAPGIPAFLMGLEWLEDTDFGTDAANRIDWSKKTTYADHFAFFQAMLELRRDGAFRSDAGHTVFHVNEGGNVIAFRRWDAQEDFVVVANFSNSDYPSYRIGVPQAGNWWEPLNSQDPVYGGTGMPNDGTLASDAIPYDAYNQSLAINLDAMALVVLQYGNPTAVEEEGVLPGYHLGRCHPNPFNPTTTIRFTLARTGPATLRIYDVTGRLVHTLVDGVLAGGEHSVAWDGRDRSGREAASGVYFYRLSAPGYSQARKMVLLK